MLASQNIYLLKATLKLYEIRKKLGHFIEHETQQLNVTYKFKTKCLQQEENHLLITASGWPENGTNCILVYVFNLLLLRYQRRPEKRSTTRLTSLAAAR